MKPKVLVTPHLLQSDQGPHVGPLQEGGFEIVYPPAGMNTLEPENIRALLEPDVVAMIASTEPFTQQLLADSHLKVIARLGVGYDSIDISSATAHGVAVTITPGTLEESVAEQTLALLLGLTRDVIGRDREVRSGAWKRDPLPRLAGRQFGLVGLGRIGQAVVPRIKGLGMPVVAFDPAQDAALFKQLGIQRCESLASLLAESDVVSLHAPCTPATESMIDRAALRLMKPDAILLNTSRGGLVDERALCEAMTDGHLFGAGLDVFQEEPLPVASDLLKLNNVLLSTHVGGIDRETTRLGGELAARCICQLSRGEWPEGYVVNQSLRDTFLWRDK